MFGKNPPFFGPKSCVFEIALVSLVGVRTYENILRPTQNPTLAGMDPLSTNRFRLTSYPIISEEFDGIASLDLLKKSGQSAS